jgi:hypothetical protein
MTLAMRNGEAVPARIHVATDDWGMKYRSLDFNIRKIIAMTLFRQTSP